MLLPLSVKRLHGVIVLMLLLLFVGCVKETTNGDTTYYAKEWWVWCSLTLGGIVAAVLGWLLRGTSDRIAWVLMVGGPVCGLILGPNAFVENATLTSSKFHLSTGIFGSATHDVSFDELQGVTITMEVTTGRRGRKNQNYYLVCSEKSGKQSKLPMSNPLVEKALPKLAQQFADKGIPVIDQAGVLGP